MGGGGEGGVNYRERREPYSHRVAFLRYVNTWHRLPTQVTHLRMPVLLTEKSRSSQKGSYAGAHYPEPPYAWYP